MDPVYQFAMALPGQGWVLLAIFREAEMCRAIAELVQMSWNLPARCVRHVGA